MVAASLIAVNWEINEYVAGYEVEEMLQSKTAESPSLCKIIDKNLHNLLSYTR